MSERKLGVCDDVVCMWGQCVRVCECVRVCRAQKEEAALRVLRMIGYDANGNTSLILDTSENKSVRVRRGVCGKW